MNIHPLIVHVPVAFLAIYALAEISTFGRLKDIGTWFWIKAFLLVTGFIGAQAALATGELARALNGMSIDRGLLHSHEQFAEMTTFIFGVLLIVYALMSVSREISIQSFLFSLAGKVHQKLSKVVLLVVRIGSFLKGKQWLVSITAAVGFILVSITGALGGALVYGPNADPFVGFVIKALGL